MEYKEVSCKRCGHIWRSRTGNPKFCSRCHSALWNRDSFYKRHSPNYSKPVQTNNIVSSSQPIVKEAMKLTRPDDLDS